MTARDDAHETALARAAAALDGVKLEERMKMLDIDCSARGEWLEFRAFGERAVISIDDLTVRAAERDRTMSVTEQILVLHYLLNDAPVRPTGEIIGFRDLPGGLFYHGPFMAQSAERLARGASTVERLKKGCGRVMTGPFGAGDFGAALHLMGSLRAYLVFRAGDEEAPPRADILFDSAVRRAFSTEDAARAAALLCAKIIESMGDQP